MNNFALEAPKAEPDKNKFGPNFAKNETSLGSCFAKMGTVPSEPKRGKTMCSFGLIKSVLCLQKTRALCPAEDLIFFASCCGQSPSSRGSQFEGYKNVAAIFSFCFVLRMITVPLKSRKFPPSYHPITVRQKHGQN